MSIPDCMTVPQGAHRWGTRGRKHNSPQPDDLCLCCHRPYRGLPVPSEHFVTPAEYPLVYLLGRMYQGRP